MNPRICQLEIIKFVQSFFRESKNLPFGNQLALSEAANSRVGSVAVSADSGNILASAHDDPTHPIKHSCMLLLDKVARTQGGGAWKVCELKTQTQFLKHKISQKHPHHSFIHTFTHADAKTLTLTILYTLIL